MDTQKELIAEYDREVATTRKILAAIPADTEFNWKPHAKSMSLGRLAGHIAETAGEWGLTTLTTDKLEFPAGHRFEPYVPLSTEALLARLDSETAATKTALAAMTPEKWDESWHMGAGGQIWVSGPKHEIWRTWVISHMVHHRAQLGVYLRLLDKPLPGSYGPSADTM